VIAAAFERIGPLTLASRSPQRRALLTQLGVVFEVVEPAYDEVDAPGLGAAELARHHAVGKARSVPGAAVLGVDTVVEVDGDVLGKPTAEDEAAAMIRRLSGREHRVHSGLCLIVHGAEHTRSAVSTVRFRALDDDDVRWYVDTGEWRERAGGYAVQGRGAALVEAVDGDYTNVVGLPVAALIEVVQIVGVAPGW
jgi:septum formation protein